MHYMYFDKVTVTIYKTIISLKNNSVFNPTPFRLSPVVSHVTYDDRQMILLSAMPLSEQCPEHPSCQNSGSRTINYRGNHYLLVGRGLVCYSHIFYT